MMKNKFQIKNMTVSAIVLGAVGFLFAAGQVSAAEAPWAAKKLSDGQPDVQGFYKPEVEGTYSLVRPSRAPGIDQLEKIKNKTIPDLKTSAKPSRIIDPADGQVPYQPWARAKQKDIEEHIEVWVRPEQIDPQALCVPGGVTRTLFWSQLQIQQFPGYVVFLFDGNHPYRVIPLDNRPHIPENIKLWMSDSRGHWEGNTLVVDVTNSNSKHRLSNEGDFASDKVHITERFKFVGADSFVYSARFEDPTVYTKPWTLSSNFYRANKKDPGYERWEVECHEGEKDVDDLFLGDKAHAPQLKDK